MSDYGADENPNIPKAQQLAYTQGFLPLDKTNVMQWSNEEEVLFQKLANKIGKSNVLVKLSDAGPFFPPPHPLDPVPAGDVCAVCWGNGKPYGVGETPSTVQITIEGVEKGPGWAPVNGEPPNATITLFQDPLVSCQFIGPGDQYFVTLVLGPGFSFIAATNVPSTTQSFFSLGVECQTFYENAGNPFFINGTATIFIPPIA